MYKSYARTAFALAICGTIGGSLKSAPAQDAPAPSTAGETNSQTGAHGTASAGGTQPTAPSTGTAPEAGQAKIITITQAYNAGLQALKRNDVDGAGQQFQKVVDLSPSDSSAQMFLGYVRLKQQRYDDALTALDAASRGGAQLSPKSRAEIQNNMGIAYWNKKQYESAFTAYETALKINPGYGEARYNLAFALLERNRAAAALPYLSQLAVENPHDPTVVDGLGEAYENTGNWSQALGIYHKAMAQFPNDAVYPLRLGLVLINTDRKEDAIPFLKQAQQLDPQNGQASLQLGVLAIEQARLGKGRWSEAQSELRNYVALQPNDFIGWYNLGVSYDFAAMFHEALDAYAQATRLQPNDAAVKNNIGRIYFKQKRLDEAEAQLRKTLDLDPTFYDAQHNLALVLTAEGSDPARPDRSKVDQADAEWQHLIDSVTHDLGHTVDKDQRATLTGRIASARAGIAENLLNQRDYADAAVEYKKLLVLTPGNIPAMSNLGLALYNERTDDALADAARTYREIIKRDPKNAIAYNNLGVVLEAQKDHAGALDSYRQAARLKPDYKEATDNIARLTSNTPMG